MKSKFNPSQAYTKDTGLVVVLILLLTAYWRAELYFLLPAIATLLVVMTVPTILKPLAVVWHYFSTALGNVTNRIVFSAIFWLVLTPVSIIRKHLGFDPMMLKKWKNGTDSVFTVRNHTITSDDLNMPY